MANKLSSSLVNEFVNALTITKTATPKGPTTFKGTAKIVDGSMRVVIDGSSIPTPAKTTVAVRDGDRVEVRIYDHSATITGNLTDVSVGEGTAKDIVDKAFDGFVITNSNFINGTIDGSIFTDGTIEGSKIKESTVEGSVFKDGTITGSKIEDSTITGSKIESGTITGSNIKDSTISGSKIENGTIEGTHIAKATFDYINGEAIKAVHADFDEVLAEKLTAEEADIKYARLDKTNIEDGWITNAYIQNGSITNAKIEDGTIETGKIRDGAINDAKIADATITAAKIHDINADTITAGTLKTERLILVDNETGETSIVKAINIANGVAEADVSGSKLQAASIEVVDLYAFNATIGGFKIGTTSLYNAKEAIDDPQPGVYIGLDGVGIGDGNLQGLEDKSPFMVKSDGTFWVGGNNGSISFDPFTGKLSIDASVLSVSSRDVSTALGQLDSLEARTTTNETTINQTANAIEIGFTQVGQKLDQNDDDWNELKQYIRFAEGNIELGESSSTFKTLLTNQELAFIENGNRIAYINNNRMHITTAEIMDEIVINNWVWKQRDSGNISFKWRNA